MKQNRLIIRAFGVIMSIFMLSAVLSKDLIKAQVVAESCIQTGQDDSESGDNQTYLSEFSSQVVIPSHAFSFTSDLLFFVSPEVKFLPSVELVKSFVRPIFRHSYFDKLFELHIAINAP